MRHCASAKVKTMKLITATFTILFHLSVFAQAQKFVTQSAREIPVEAEVDVLVIGGSTAAVAAAQAAAAEGASVYLMAPRLYLGEDMCATLRLRHADDFKPALPLAKEIFKQGNPAKPGHVKAVLAQTLLDAGVRFLYGCYATDLLRDADDNPCGAIIANRAGRQAVIAKVIIDATEYAWFCRMAGCELTPWQGGGIDFERTLFEKQADGQKGYAGRRVSLEIAMQDFSFASLGHAENTARDQTASDSLLRGAERVFCVPPVMIPCNGSAIDTPASFKPRDKKNLYILGGLAGVPRPAMAELLQPGGMIASGAMVGKAAAIEARTLKQPESIHLAPLEKAVSTKGDIREVLAGTRPLPRKHKMLNLAGTSVPVLDTVDVVVIGGGTSGAAAAIAAARNGADTLVVEYQEGLGGIGTLGQISKPYHGRKTGFAGEVPFPKRIEEKLEWYRSELRKAGGRSLLYTLGCGVFADGSTVKGAVVCTPEGRGVILAKVVIDATGNADIAVAAGAGYLYGTIEQGDIALQGTGLSTRTPGKDFNNSDHMLVDENDMTDVWRALASTHLVNKNSFDVGTLILTRERRRVIGDFTMRYIDQIAGRTYPDAIVFSGSDYDSHGYPSAPYFALLPHDEKSRKENHPAPGGTCYTPYRCLLPQGLDNILVTGLAISMDRDASAMVRMQLDMANQGYAAGTAAAMAARTGRPPREIDVRALQKHLVDIGGIEREVLAQEDNYPLPDAEIADAVNAYGASTNPQSAGRAIAVMLTHPEKAIPLLKQACLKAEGPPKMRYAQALGILGEKEGVPALIRAAESIDKWDDKIYQGHMADYAHLPTPQDSIITALGYSGDPAALPVLIKLAGRLDADVTLSHHRAIALALEKLKDPAAADVLAQVLQKPDMRGYAMTEVARSGSTEKRTESLREIILARALYRCGDHDGVGQAILEEYRRDLRGLFARHAAAVLAK